ncbi:MAG: triose-phosphate isomerase [Flavisolibacter sp.]
MRKQIAAANWKMNLSYQDAEKLISEILEHKIELEPRQQVIFAVPFPYLIMAKSGVADERNYLIAAQNCSDKENGAYTGEVSASMLKSIGVEICVIGHSERREYYGETNAMLAEKVNRCLEHSITPLFCCGESLEIRDNEGQNEYVKVQLQESLFHLSTEQVSGIIIAYEPIWAIGTGRTATAAQAQEMHAFIRSVLAAQWGEEVAQTVPVLYGGSVKAGNASELFGNADVDGGLVGGASLVARDFVEIIKALKK